MPGPKQVRVELPHRAHHSSCSCVVCRTDQCQNRFVFAFFLENRACHCVLQNTPSNNRAISPSPLPSSHIHVRGRAHVFLRLTASEEIMCVMSPLDSLFDTLKLLQIVEAICSWLEYKNNSPIGRENMSVPFSAALLESCPRAMLR